MLRALLPPVLPVKDTCNESILNKPDFIPRSNPLVKTADTFQSLAQSSPLNPQSEWRLKSKTPPERVVVGLV